MVARAEEGEGLLWMSEANVLSAQKELKEPVNFHTAWKNDMHEPVEILSPSRRSSLPSLTFFELSFSPFFRSPSSLVSPFYFSFCRRISPPASPSPPFTLAARGYWPLSNLIFSHSGDAEKHLRAIKDRRWKVQTIVKKREKER